MVGCIIHVGVLFLTAYQLFTALFSLRGVANDSGKQSFPICGSDQEGSGGWGVHSV